MDKTRVEVGRSQIGDKQGWAFSVYFRGAKHANFVSALYKTKVEAFQASQKYLETGDFELYGSAE